MAKWAPGHSRSTAWASTWAVEWRSTARPCLGVGGDHADLGAVGQRGVEVDLDTVEDWRRRPPWPGGDRSTRRSWRAVVPGSNSLVEPSGSRTVTAAMGVPFSRSVLRSPVGRIRTVGGAPGPGSAGGPGRHGHHVDGRPAASWLQGNAQQIGAPDHRNAGPGRQLVQRGQGPGGVEVVVEMRPHAPATEWSATVGGRRPGRRPSATVSAAGPPRACPPTVHSQSGR